MKTKSFIAIVLLALSGALAVPSVRAESATHERKPSKKALEKYDADKDGKLNAEEEALMKADREKAKADRKHKKPDGEATSAEPTR